MTTIPFYDDARATVWHGDCVAVLAGFPDNHFDAVITDPPYGLEFMGKDWDRPWKGRGDNPGSAGMALGGFVAGNGYANRETPTYGRGWRNLRCRLCGHITSGASPCTCATPDLVSEGPGSVPAMRAFQAWCETWAAECLRVLKPGGYMLAFGGTRTWHRLVCAVEDAGFEVRDSVAWLYGSGFPKSLDVSKAIDKAAGAEREVTGRTVTPFRVDAAATRGTSLQGSVNGDFSKQTEGGYRYTEHTAPATPEAQRWAGYGTSMKPGHEPVCVARKPLDGTVAGNVLKWGTGAINIDAMRIGVDPNDPNIRADASRSGTATSIGNGTVYMGGEVGRGPSLQHAQGRWPANVALDSETAAALDQTTGETSYNPPGKFGVQRTDANDTATVKYQTRKDGDGIFGYGDRGGPSRYFYTAKAPADERVTIDGVSHVTVKPLDLMRWLIRGYAGPKGALILDPFAGSGTTGEAAIAEGMRVVLIEQDETYLPLIKARVTRRTDPVEHLRTVGEDLGLFGLEDAP